MIKIILSLFIFFLLFSCKENSKTSTTKFTDVSIKDSVIKTPAITVAIDTIVSDSIKLALLNKDSIKAGNSIGNVKLNAETAEAIKILGTPDSSDAAMSKAYNGWFNKPTMNGADTIIASFETFSVVSGKNEKETASRIKRIRVTDPQYKTDKQIRNGNTLAYIKLQYPTLKKPIAKITKDSGEELELFDETGEGIAFEIINNKCVAIIIHEKGKKYLNTSF